MKRFRNYFLNARGPLSSLGVAFLFYAFNFPAMAPKHRLRNAGIACGYALLVYLGVYGAYFLQRAVNQKLFRRANRKLSLPEHFAVAFPGSALGLLAATRLEAWIIGETYRLSEFGYALPVSIFICLMFLFYHSYREKASEALELQAAKARSDLHVLKTQMQPHFLFNSLNGLAALIEIDPQRAGQMSQQLADLYRLILELSRHESASLEDEFKVAKLYLELEKVRFAARLEFSISLHPFLSAKRLPSLAVQTLVENAVKHGIGPSESGGHVNLMARPVSRGWELVVENSGSPLKAWSEGTGVRNTRERLRLFFGDAVFSLSHESGKTYARVLVPETTPSEQLETNHA